MDELINLLLSNADVSRVLCIAIALTAQQHDAEIDAKELSVRFHRIVRSLDRKTFADECRKLERMGPERYLETATRSLKK